MTWKQVVRPGDTVVDATCGNGSDTVKLAHLVGVHGTVIAMDIQEVVAKDAARLVCFNLGFLPSSDRTLITQPDTTSAAITAATKVVSAGGMISIMAYRGHPGGQDEYERVVDLVSRLPRQHWVSAVLDICNSISCVGTKVANNIDFMPKADADMLGGLRIYPGKGILYIRIDGQQFLFLDRKCKSLYHQRLRPAKLAWTTMYRKAHKKDQVTEIARKKRRTASKGQTRSIAGASVEVINKRRMEKPEVRLASREAAIREVKERAKKVKAEKVAAKSSTASKQPAKQAQKAVGRGKR